MKKATKLRIIVKRNGKEKVNLKFPIYTLKHIESLMPEIALSKLKERSINLKELIKKVEESGNIPQTLFEIDDSEKSYRVWIE